MSAMAPNEIYKLTIGEKQAHQLSHLNDAVLSKVQMNPLESFWFTGAEGAKVQGFLAEAAAIRSHEALSGEVPDSRRAARRMGR